MRQGGRDSKVTLIDARGKARQRVEQHCNTVQHTKGGLKWALG